MAIITRGEIPDYLDDEFYSMFGIWNATRLTGKMPIDKGWAEIPKYLTDIVTIFQSVYDGMRGK